MSLGQREFGTLFVRVNVICCDTNCSDKEKNIEMKTGNICMCKYSKRTRRLYKYCDFNYKYTT